MDAFRQDVAELGSPDGIANLRLKVAGYKFQVGPVGIVAAPFEGA